MKLKKKNADQEIQNTSVSRQELLHNIRISTEKDRIIHYKGILEGPAKTYYEIVESFA